MGPRWKLTVEGLGKIEHAEVEVRPLMLFVGENNSGKSYLATLLWGLLTLPELLFDSSVTSLPSWIACSAWLKQRVEGYAGSNVSYEMTREDRGLFVSALDDLLALKKDAFARELFNNDSVTIRNIRIDGSSQEDPLSIFPEDMSWEEDIPFLMRNAAFGSSAGAIFLPASRTGFMLLYKALIRRQLRQLRQVERAREDSFDLTSPAVQFAELLAIDLKKSKGKYSEEADFLEAGLNGRVELVSGAVGVNEYVYYPAGSESPLTMAMSSSLVTEIAPIVLVLRHMSSFPVLILEEPEAHLHPKLQRKLAQVIVRLIRKGLYVWITTHSENFCQQINNFLKIGALDAEHRAEAQQKLGYGKQDYLLLDDVTGYQFKLDETGERSIVTPLKRAPRGMAMPTFNKELIDLAKEIDYLDEQAQEEE